MNVLRTSLTCLVVLLVATGCGSVPQVTVSDPVVFTNEHLVQATRIAQTGDSVPRLEPSAQMNEFFLKDRKNSPLLNEMLLTPQRRSEHLQRMTRMHYASLALQGLELPSKAAEPQSPDHVQMILNFLKELFGETEAIDNVDSPFDAIDRAHDLYTAYFIKQLRGIPVVRRHHVLNHNEQYEVPSEREILLVFQVTVNPGTGSDRMAGVRMRVKEVKCGKGVSLDPADIRIHRLHPMRPYDVDDTQFNQHLLYLQSLAVTAQAGSSTVEGGREASDQQDQRLQYLSRISKQAAYVDAPNRTFGWNFYPTNLEVSRAGLIRTVLGVVDNPREFIVNGYLEGGARDCAVFLKVPGSAASLTIEIASLHASVDRSWPFLSGARPHPTEVSTMTVQIPKYHPDEDVHLSFPGNPALHILSHECHAMIAVQRRHDEFMQRALAPTAAQSSTGRGTAGVHLVADHGKLSIAEIQDYRDSLRRRLKILNDSIGQAQVEYQTFMEQKDAHSALAAHRVLQEAELLSTRLEGALREAESLIDLRSVSVQMDLVEPDHHDGGTLD